MSWTFAYNSPKEITRLLDETGLKATKKFGQNFLLSEEVRQRIVNSTCLSPSKCCWEIGPGIGALTTLLLKTGADVTAFEIDHGFCRILRDMAFPDEERFHLIEGDALKTWKDEFAKNELPDVICGNLPYNVGSVCIANLIENSCLPKIMVFTLQKEVADRITAGPGSKSWSSFSVLGQMDYTIQKLMDIKGGSFFPPPKIDSTVVFLRKKETSSVPEELRTLFLEMVRDMFSMRRKTLKNNLFNGKTGSRYSKGHIEKAMVKAEIDGSIRAEKLTINQMVTLTEALRD